MRWACRINPFSRRLLQLIATVASLIFATLLQAATNSFPHYNVRVWQIDDGLPQNSVWAISQSKDGYLWVGTQQGLTRFDGMRFTAVDSPAAPDLKHGFITALCAGNDGSMWIGCSGAGLFHLHNGEFTHYTESDGLPTNHLNCIIEAKDGTIWIGSDLGVTHLENGNFTSFNERYGIAPVKALFQDRQGRIRAATSRGLSAISKEGAVSTMHFGLGTTSNILKSACEDFEGNIWVASNEGVTCARGDDRITYGTAEGLPERITAVVFRDRQGRIWAGTYNGIAGLADGRTVCAPLNEAGFGDRVYTMFEDREENLWVGAQDGLYRVKPGRFRTYTTQEGLSVNNVMSVYEDQTESVWIATWGGGLNVLRDDKITALGSNSGLHDKALSLHKARDGSLWIGMDHGGGLNRLRNGRQRASRQGGLIDAAIRVIHEDHSGALWVGTSHGLNIVRRGKVETYSAPEMLPGNIVWAIAEDAGSNVWVGTDGGLMRWKDGKHTTFTTRDGLANNSVDAIYEDTDHVLWLGTRGGGVNRLQSGKFTTYSSREGLFSDEIYEILEDDHGFLWMSCRSGIFRSRKKDFEEFDDRKLKSLTCVAFGKADGVASIQCNGVAKPAGCKGKNGRLWFATIRGVVRVETGIQGNEAMPPVLIEEAVVDGQTTQRFDKDFNGKAVQPALKIPPGHGQLEVHYTALSLRAPEKNRYRYKLEGLDSDWIDAGNRREAVYNNIGPGTYRFRVIACNNDGVWNEAGAILPVTFLPHFWQTWWFKAAVPLVFAALLWSYYRLRLSRIQAIERLRVQIAADLHDDVGSRLTKVAMVTEHLERQTDGQEQSWPHIRKIASTTREVIQAMDEIVWTINPKNDTLDNLANYIFQYAQEYFQNTAVRCRLDLPARLPDLPLSTEERHNLFMAFKEALQNVLKHSGATEVRIGLSLADDKLVISVVDNGRGFTVNGSNGHGNGLANMNNRLQQIGGELRVDSNAGAGTRIEMQAPVG